jgi:DNA-binding LytR/AlgR family response regulator
MLRAKLSDLDVLHDGRHGIQINRSQWVSFAAIASVVDEENGQVTLNLVNGDSATVSRTRRLVFMQLYNSHRARQA